MTNHVRNVIALSGPLDDVFRAKDLLIVENEQSKNTPAPLPMFMSSDGALSKVDFGRVTPMPDILNRVISPISVGVNGRTLLYRNDDNPFLENSREATPEEQVELDSIPFESWYDWSLQNWGTKWNGYDFRQISSHATYEFSFDTAWSSPHPIIDELAKRFPKVSFDVMWFDEGWCHAGQGSLGREGSGHVSEDLYVEPNAELYKEVYGDYPYCDYADVLPTEDIFRLANNFTCEDVASASDAEGYYPITAIISSDDPDISDTEMDDLRKMRQILLLS